MKGLELSRLYFEEIYHDILKTEFKELYPRIAVGLVGEGSECFSYDDNISRDHDFGASCCIWLEENDYLKYKEKLENRFKSLPKSFKGFPVITNFSFDDKRRGVLNIDDFYYKFIGKNNVPESINEWRVIPENALATVTNGEVFLDNLGKFTEIRNELKKYYPEDIRLNKIATRCMKLGQSGQYNLLRTIRRKEYVAARLAETEFIENAIHLVFLLNREYKIFYKWSHKRLKELNILGEKIYNDIKILVENKDLTDVERISKVEEISISLVDELKRQKISNVNSYFLCDHGPYIQQTIKNTSLKNWTPWED